MKGGEKAAKKQYIAEPKFHSSRKWTSFMRALQRTEANKKVHPVGSGKRMRRF